MFDPSSLIPTRHTRDDITVARQKEKRKTRRKYARIQMVHTGVLTPPLNFTFNFFNFNSTTTAQSMTNDTDTSRYTVPFIIILEPLHLGVLPSSVVPVLFAILVIVALGVPIARRVHAYLEGVARLAKAEEEELVLLGVEKEKEKDL